MDYSDRKSPILTSLQDLTIIEALDPETDEPKYVTFYVITPDEEFYFGQLFKKKKEISLAEYSSALEYVKDEEVYPLLPENIPSTTAPDGLNENTVFVKRPGLNCYETMKGSGYIPKAILEETVIMEQISAIPHPNIIGYFGCRIKRGRITALVLERLDETLTQFSRTPAFKQLDLIEFYKALESAVRYLHSLGLAHNDINPDNIMLKDSMPILIDFGSCQPFGANLQSLGTDGWYEELFFTSEKKHDEYSLKKLQQWLQNPE
ncbi:kinase-like domain-containing protein [Annulohypoxylon bovei var. microspora]|nr:kinase-like domain-containing protein [Annulohypoxylon bovei var. microspora]